MGVVNSAVVACLVVKVRRKGTKCRTPTKHLKFSIVNFSTITRLRILRSKWEIFEILYYNLSKF